MTYHCGSCFRVEQRTNGVLRVVSPGGSRRCPVPGRAALRVLADSARGQSGPVAAVCDACGLPMVAEGDVPRIPWTIDSAAGAMLFRADGTIEGPDGAPLSFEEAERWLDRVLPQEERDPSPNFGLFQGSLLLLMLAPLAVWVFSVVFVSAFLYQFPVPVVGGP